MKKFFYKFFVIFVSLLVCNNSVFANDVDNAKSKNTTITMSALDAVKLAGNLVNTGNYDSAQDILIKMPITKNLHVEIERWFLLAQIEQKKGNFDEAIKIYRKILDDQPELSKVRYELALCYMAKKQWYRADYNLRLAMAGNNIPDEIKQRMMYLRYVARQNKNWNVWFDFGAAPDNNVNQAKGGKECITNEWGTFCRDLPEPESAIGTTFLVGGDYEFKLSDNWRWKNDGNLYANIYDKHQYNDLYLSSSTGPRYIWENGDVWFAATANRRWYGQAGYSWAYGGKIDTNYDFSRKLSSGLVLRVMNNSYDDYGDWMNGMTYDISPRVAYSFNSTKYLLLRGSFARDTAKVDAYANRKYGVGLVYRAEFLYGFRVSLEPYFSWINYDGERWVVKDNEYQAIKAEDFMQRYSISLANNKFDIKGFVPLLTLSYTKKDSNIPAREYKKWEYGISIQQKF